MTKDNETHEVVGTFDTHDDMEEAVNVLQSEGFARNEISVLGSESAVEEKLGLRHVDPQLLEDSPEAPRSHVVKKEDVGVGQGVLVGAGMLAGAVVAIAVFGDITLPGMMIAAIIGILIGGAVGAIFARWMGKRYVEFFQNQIVAGGLLVWVKTPDATKVTKAKTIMKEHGARNVHRHELDVDAAPAQPVDSSIPRQPRY